MLERGKRQGGALRSLKRAARATPGIICLGVEPAFSQTMFEQMASGLADLRQHQFMTFALLLGVLVFAATTAVVLVRTRSKFAARLAGAQGDIAILRDEAERAIALLLAEPQVVIVWRDQKSEPAILGDALSLSGTSVSPRRILAFGSWLDAARAHALEQAVDALRKRGESFSLTLSTKAGRHVEADGRPVGGAAVLRFRDVTGAKLDHALLTERHQKLEGEMRALQSMIEAAPAPIWIRDADDKLAYANRAYANAVEANPADVITRGIELLDSGAREEAARVRSEGTAFTKRVPAVVAGSRRMLDVYEAGNGRGAAGIGIDASEAERLRADLARAISAHRRTLDQLATGVATFGPDQRLIFHNDAYRKLFDFDASFLEDRPTDSAILDRLRANRQLPEQADFRAWKAQLHEAYRTPETREHWWYLPGGRALRVVTTANPEGGVT